MFLDTETYIKNNKLYKNIQKRKCHTNIPQHQFRTYNIDKK